MTSKFDDLYEQIISESNFGYSRYRAMGGKRDRAGWDDMNHGVEKVPPHYIVYGDDKCKAWYQKNMPDSTMAKRGWKIFNVSKGYNASLAAREFAKKWGLKEPQYIWG